MISFLNIKRVNLRCKTQDIIKNANIFTKSSSELKKEVDKAEIEINSLNKVYILLYVSYVCVIVQV
jgi:hypothetical protein